MTVLLLVSAGLAIYLLAAVAQGVTGFGSALVAVPLLAFVVDPVVAVVATTTVGCVLSGWSFRKERTHADGPAVRTLVISGVVGIPVGLLLLVALDGDALRIVIGVVVLLLVGLIAAGVRVPAGAGTQRIAGVTSGALLAATGMNGPPLVIVLSGRPQRVARATLQGVFAVQDLLAVAGFALVGQVSWRAAALALAGIVVVPVGWRIGDLVFHRLRPEHLRLIVLVGLAISGVVTIAQAR